MSYVRKRRGVTKHYKRMTFAEISVFDVIILEANYKREPLGFCKITMEELRSRFECGINTVRRATRGLEDTKYIERQKGGWLLLNRNGESPVDHPLRSELRVQDAECRGSKMDPCPRESRDPKRIDQGSETDPCRDPKRIDQGSETDPWAPPNPQKTSELETPKKGKKVSKKGKKEKKPQFNVKWNGKDDFIGPDAEALKTHIKERYVEELGSPWTNAIWALIIEWCQDYPEKIAAKKDDGAFVTGWYRRDAKEERKGKKQNAANAYTSWEEEAFESPTSDEDKERQRWKIAACEQKHGQHRDGELKPGSNYAFCRHECGYHKPLEGA